MRLWKKDYDDILLDGSPHETLGFSKNKGYYDVPAILQKFMIKNYNLNSIEQIDDIKKQLISRKILIINAREILSNNTIPVQELKNLIEEIKIFLKKCGGSLGRIGDQFLILTPSPQIKISN